MNSRALDLTGQPSTTKELQTLTHRETNVDRDQEKHLTTTSGIPKHTHVHQHVHISYAALSLTEESLKKYISQLSTDEGCEGLRMNAQSQGELQDRADRVSAYHLKDSCGTHGEKTGNQNPVTTFSNSLGLGDAGLDWVFSLINFSIASALSSEKLKLSEYKKTDMGI